MFKNTQNMPLVQWSRLNLHNHALAWNMSVTAYSSQVFMKIFSKLFKLPRVLEFFELEPADFLTNS
jgi:hypothetical protein